MKVNKVIKELKKIRNEYGNVEVLLFNDASNDFPNVEEFYAITEIVYNKNSEKIEIL